MPAYSVLILICGLNTGHADCQPETAIDVMRGPRTESAMMCMMAGQAMVAQTVLAPREGLEYVKIICAPSAQNIRAASRVFSTDD